MKMIAGLEEDNHSDQQKDEEVVENEFRVILNWFKAMNAEIDRIGSDEQKIGKVWQYVHYIFIHMPVMMDLMLLCSWYDGWRS